MVLVQNCIKSCPFEYVHTTYMSDFIIQKNAIAIIWISKYQQGVTVELLVEHLNLIAMYSYKCLIFFQSHAFIFFFFIKSNLDTFWIISIPNTIKSIIYVIVNETLIFKIVKKILKIKTYVLLPRGFFTSSCASQDVILLQKYATLVIWIFSKFQLFWKPVTVSYLCKFDSYWLENVLFLYNTQSFSQFIA